MNHALGDLQSNGLAGFFLKDTKKGDPSRVTFHLLAANFLTA
ncbi:hypothetical protein MARINOS108_20057 [Marinoscillum sp. 108]|nr:hypothetical protein MARINOS108_20057 [Marinoscillum sp. 108]